MFSDCQKIDREEALKQAEQVKRTESKRQLKLEIRRGHHWDVSKYVNYLGLVNANDQEQLNESPPLNRRFRQLSVDADEAEQD